MPLVHCPSFPLNGSSDILPWHLKLEALTASGRMTSSQGQFMYEIIRALVLVIRFPPLNTALSLPFWIVSVWPFIHSATVYRGLSIADNQDQRDHIGFTRVAYCTKLSVVRTQCRALTFILSVSAQTWPCAVHLITIHFHSTLPHDHLVIK